MITAPFNIEILGLVFFTALFLSLFIVPATVMLARKVGAVDIPKERSSHSAPTTRLGGLGIAVSMILSCLMFLPLHTLAWAFMSGLLVIVATGLIDDIVDVGARGKFVGQIAAAAVFVLSGGGSLVNLGGFLGFGDMTLGSFAIPFTIFCMVGGMNAFNLSDGLDGLAGGLAAIAVVFFIYFAKLSGAPFLLLVGVALLGAVIGFLRYNSYPAKLFMGDVGSLTLGYVLAALLVSGSQRGEVPLAAWAMVLALPLLDTLLVMAQRVRYGHSPFKPDRTHLHHRLMALGLSHPTVVVVMYAVMAFFGILAVALLKFPDWYTFIALCVTGALLFGGVSGLQRAGVTVKRGGSKRSYISFRQYPLFLRAAKWVMENVVRVSMLLMLLVCLPVLFFPLPDLSRNEVLALFMLAGMVGFYGLHPTQTNMGMLHGSIYVSIFVLFFLFNLTADASGGWPRVYLATVSLLAALWVVAKIVFRKNTSVLRTSSFELLMVFLSWFLPFVLFEELRLPMNVVEAGRSACLQVLPLMLSAKIYFNLQPQGNRWVVWVMVGAMLLVVLRDLAG